MCYYINIKSKAHGIETIDEFNYPLYLTKDLGDTKIYRLPWHREATANTKVLISPGQILHFVVSGPDPGHKVYARHLPINPQS